MIIPMSSNTESKPADKAWITITPDMVKTSQLHEFAKDFLFWKSTDEGKTNMDDHEKKVQFIREKLSKEHIESLTEDELLACYSKLYATSNIHSKQPFFKKNVIDANGGFEYVKKQIQELLYGKSDIENRYEQAINNIKQFADSTISEIINNIFPNQCCMWNDMVVKAIPLLGLSKLIPQKFLAGKSLRLGVDYKKCNELFSYVKDELEPYGIINFYHLDALFWYTASRKYWRIQPGENGEWWDEQQRNNIIGVSWDIKEDLSKTNDISETVIKYRIKKQGQSKVSKQLQNFLNVLQIGDFIVANNGYSEILGVGKVKSTYQWNPKFEKFPHTRQVEWFDTTKRTITKQDWGRITINKLDYDTFKQITDNQQTQMQITNNDLPLNKFSKILEEKLQIVLYGPPGTGKTFLAKKLATDFFTNEYLKNKEPSKIFEILQNAEIVDIVQFHPSYSYEDFVEGIRPEIDEKSSMVNYEIRNGIFKKLCLAAESINNDTDHYYALISDYIQIKTPVRAEKLSLQTSHGGGMNEYTKNEFQKILDHVLKDKDTELPESFSTTDNFSAFFRLNTREKSNYGDIDGVRYHFSEYAHSYKKFFEAIQKGNVAVAYHDRKREGFIGIGIINKGNVILNPKFILIIDEINRGNLSKIFGELIYGLEYRDTSIKTQYSEFTGKSNFLKIPKNLLIIGTMNTADRSISLFDTALRRRFAFIELLPDYNFLSELFNLGSVFNYETTLKKLESDENNILIISLLAIFKINEGIMKNIQLGREKQIGQSYLIPLSKDPNRFYNIWRYEIIPLLEEFYYSELEKLESIFDKTIFEKVKGIKNFEEKDLIKSLRSYIRTKDDQTDNS